MLSGKELSFIDSLLIAASGMAIVMLELILIALMIIVLSKLVRVFNRNKEQEQVPVVKTAANDEVDEVKAVIMSVIACELKTPIENLEFKAITESR